MFGLFKSRRAPTDGPDMALISGRTGPETALGQAQMTLQERMEVRREMAFSSVREHFLHLGVLPATYRMKIVPADERHHRFIIVIDAKREFEAISANTRATLDDAEQYIASQTYYKYGIRIDGIYWRLPPASHHSSTGRRTAPDTSDLSAQRIDAESHPTVKTHRTKKSAPSAKCTPRRGMYNLKLTRRRWAMMATQTTN